MKKQTLEEQVSRIKGMMGKIMTESFEENTNSEPWKLKKGDYVVSTNGKPYHLLSDEIMKQDPDGNPYDGWSPSWWFRGEDKDGKHFLIPSHILSSTKRITKDEFDNWVNPNPPKQETPQSPVTPPQAPAKPQGPSEEAQQLANKILTSVANSSDVYAEMENAGHYGSEIYIPLTDEEGNLLEYSIDIFVTSSSSFTPGRSFMSNGDVGYPDEGEPAEYEFGGVTLSVQTADGQEIYGGKDFTNIFDFEFSDGSKMEDLLFEKFDDSIRKWESERD